MALQYEKLRPDKLSFTEVGHNQEKSWEPPALSSINSLVSELFLNPKQLHQKSNIQHI